MPERLKLYLFNGYFYTLFVICAITLIPLLTLFVAVTRPFTTHRGAMKRFRRAMVWWGRVIAAIPYPLAKVTYEIAGTNDTSRAFIFICNHRSAIDAFLMKVLPHEFVEIVNDWPFRIPVLGFYARYAAFLDIKNMSNEEFRERASKLLSEGVSIVFFPEGTRSIGNNMGSFHSAAFRLALATKVPVIPLCLSGNEIVMPKGSPLLYPGTVRVRQLAPVTWDDYGNLTPFLFKKKVWDLMKNELDAMENTL